MTAIAFIKNSAKGGQPDAPAYYRMFPTEPIPGKGSIRVGTIQNLPKMTAWQLLEGIKGKAEKGQDILCVSHGIAEGLSIPLVPGSEAFLQENVLDVLKAYEEGKEAAGSAAPKLFLSPEKFEAFWQLIHDVRALKLGRVDLRACIIGSKKTTLEKLKAFFGCSRCCAPVSFDVFGTIDPGTPGPTAIEKLRKKFKDSLVTGTAPNRFALHVDAFGTTYDAAADSKTAVKNWVRAHLPSEGSSYVEGTFPVHGIIPLKGKKRIIWAGEEDYRSLLAEV